MNHNNCFKLLVDLRRNITPAQKVSQSPPPPPSKLGIWKYTVFYKKEFEYDSCAYID